MHVDPHQAAGQTEHQGRTYYFCSTHCQSKFATGPNQYVQPGAERPAAAAVEGEVVEYTSPMHPEIRQPGPGSCPICGMALEPVTVTADTGPSPEHADMTRTPLRRAPIHAPRAPSTIAPQIPNVLPDIERGPRVPAGLEVELRIG